MIIPIDRSPLWRVQRTSNEDLNRLLEALFRGRRGRRPASGLEILLLASALECSEATIGQHRDVSRKPKVPAACAGESISTGPTGDSSTPRLLRMQAKVPQPYSPTKPA